ncbi:MAG: competence protein ComJ [Rhizobacter sp.]|nr:competence protein ComJ [Rhizobacter sp.]
MLAYRHAFHAGNHADVLKHLVLAHVLRYMAEKDTPYTLVDTHAGAGGYSVEGKYALKKAEFEQGVGRLWSRKDLPPAVADYMQLVRQFNPDGQFEQYPGSPAFAQMLLRPKDRLRLFELHSTDYRILESFLAARGQTEITQSDGFAALKNQLPPASRRGVVLMDPSYELKADYGKVVSSLRESVQRFAEGVYLLWYPQVQKLEAAQLPQRVINLAPKGWLHVRLTVQLPDSQGFGLAGSGLVVLNPPWRLHDMLMETLPYLVDQLGQYDGANFLLEQHQV